MHMHLRPVRGQGPPGQRRQCRRVEASTTAGCVKHGVEALVVRAPNSVQQKKALADGRDRPASHAGAQDPAGRGGGPVEVVRDGVGGHVE